jgi:hypothetical protein
VALGIGLILPLVIGVLATLSGLDRDRAFYPVVMIVIALLYVLYAAIGASTEALLVDGAIALVFIAVAVAGFRTSLWLAAVALAAHGVMDLFHASLVLNPGVPIWWPEFCGAYDVVAAGYLGWLITTGRIVHTQQQGGK